MTDSRQVNVLHEYELIIHIDSEHYPDWEAIRYVF